jgi:lambda family phage tail tape measure protein
MTDLATLNIRVDSKDVERMTQILKQLGQETPKAEKATDALRDSVAKMNQQAKEAERIAREKAKAEEKAQKQIISAIREGDEARKKSIDEAKRGLDDYYKSIEKTEEKTSELDIITKKFVNTILTLGALKSVTFFLRDSILEFSNWEAGLRKIENQLKATGRASEITAGQIEDMANRIGRETLASSNDVVEATAILSTYSNVATKDFERLIRTAQDMSAVFGKSLPEAIRFLGASFDEPLQAMSRLREMGLKLGESEKKIIELRSDIGGETNQAASSKLINDFIESRVKGTGTAETQGLKGAIDEWGESTKQFKRVIGELLEPAAAKMLQFASSGLSGSLFALPKLPTNIQPSQPGILTAPESTTGISFDTSGMLGAGNRKLYDTTQDQIKALELTKQLNKFLEAEKVEREGIFDNVKKQYEEIMKLHSVNADDKKILTEKYREYEKIVQAQQAIAAAAEKAKSDAKKEALIKKTGGASAGLFAGASIGVQRGKEDAKTLIEAEKYLYDLRYQQMDEEQKREADLLREREKRTEQLREYTKVFGEAHPVVRNLAEEIDRINNTPISSETAEMAAETIERTWRDGATAALRDYYDTAKDEAAGFQELVSNSFSRLEDGIRHYTRTGKFEWKSMITSMLEDLAVLEFRKAAAGLLGNILGDSTGGGGTIAGSVANAAIGAATGAINVTNQAQITVNSTGNSQGEIGAEAGAAFWEAVDSRMIQTIQNQRRPGGVLT